MTLKSLLILAAVGLVGCMKQPRPRLILHDGAILQNATVENLTIEIDGKNVRLYGNDIYPHGKTAFEVRQ